MMNMRKKLNLILVTLLLVMAIPFTSFAVARDDTTPPDDNIPEDEITITILVPDGFTRDVTVFFDDIPRYLGSRGNYCLHTKIAEGTYPIKAVVESDVANEIRFTGPSVFNTKDKDLTLTLYDTYEEPEEIGDDAEKEYAAEEITVEKTSIDLSNGSKDSGLVHVQAKFYSAVLKATYVLVSEEGRYQIELDTEHNFEADVKLPAGAYTEGADCVVTLDPDANRPNALYILWSHKPTEMDYGKVFEVKAGAQTDITDLYLVTTLDGVNIEELNSKALFHKTLQENYEKAVEAHVDEVLNSSSEAYVPEETSAPAGFITDEPTDEKKPFNVFFIIGGILVVIALIGNVILKLKDKNASNEEADDEDEDY